MRDRKGRFIVGHVVGVTHGKSRSREYNSWKAMKRRCNKTNSANYKDYGGRGITICEEWLNFENFYQDMGDRPSGTTLDRIDNDGNYELSNCKWSTPTEQNTNKRAQELRADNTSGVSGVCFDKQRGRWKVVFRKKHVGNSKNFKEACAMRAKVELKGGHDA